MARTPGPWTLDGPGTEHVVEDDYHVITAGDFSSGDERTGFFLAGYMTQDDARLIAAAPTLLAALEHTVEAWTSQFERNGHLAPAWVREARAAIALAKGGV